MKKFKRFLDTVFCPAPIIIFICCFVAGVLMVYVFTKDVSGIMAYITYFFSAYSFTILLIYAIPAVWGVLRRVLSKIPVMDRYMTDRAFRAHTAIYFGLIGNSAYSVFYFTMAFLQKSYWQMVLAFYNITYTVMRFMLIRNYGRAKKKGSEREQLIQEWKSYGFCGALMLLMSATMTGIIDLSIENGRNAGGEILTITIATYTFYCVITAVINIIKFKKENSPILLASKNVCFARAMMSLFSLQITMFSQFGGTDSAAQYIMDIVLGLVVCLLCVGTAVIMLIRAGRVIKKINNLGG